MWHQSSKQRLACKLVDVVEEIVPMVAPKLLMPGFLQRLECCEMKKMLIMCAPITLQLLGF